MTLIQFNTVIHLLVTAFKKNRKAYELGLDLSEFTEIYSSTITELFSIILTKEGIDWLEWFLYEKGYISDGIGRPDMQAYHTDPTTGEETEIIMTLNDLYEYLVENNYIKCKIQP
jgi:hypothetical protein